MSSRVVLAFLFAASSAALPACTNRPTSAPKGACAPTVEGCPGGTFKDFEAAKRAFTRTASDGSLTATLEDVAWLRYEGEEEATVQKHRAYFEQGYTTFETTSFTKEFVQPTSETWVLEDSSGARVTGRPVSYQGAMGMEHERYAARFSLSFRHAITKDLTWLRLTRMTDGTRLEWTFPGGGATGAPAEAGIPAAAATDVEPARARLPQGQPLYHPRNPAPDAGTANGAYVRPVNLLTHPEARPAFGASCHPPPAAVPAEEPAPAMVAPPIVEPVPPPALAPTSPAPAAPPAASVPVAPAPTDPPTGALPPPQSRRVPPR